VEPGKFCLNAFFFLP